MKSIDYFTLDQNRSERALQVARLAPALSSSQTRWELLSKVPCLPHDPIEREESDTAQVMHFVWVLRDTFHFEREQAALTRDWGELRVRWQRILKLPAWAASAGPPKRLVSSRKKSRSTYTLWSAGQ